MQKRHDRKGDWVMSAGEHDQALKTHLTALPPAQVLCFACACAERWAPVLEFASSELAGWVKAVIAEGWNLCGQNLLPALPLPYLEQACRKELEEDDLPYHLTPQIREDAIAAALYMAKYAHSLDVTYAVLSGTRTEDAAYQLAQDLLGTRIFPSDLTLVEYKTELLRQWHDIERLESGAFDDQLWDQIRANAQAAGQQTKQQIEQFGAQLLRGDLDKNRAFPLWVQALDDKYTVIQRQAVDCLVQIQDARTIEPLWEKYNRTEEQTLKTLILFGLAELREPRVVQPMLSFLEVRPSGIRKMAATALGKIGDPQAILSLLRRLADESSEVRHSAIWALGEISDPQAIAPLRKLAAVSSDSSIQAAVQAALAKIQAKP